MLKRLLIFPAFLIVVSWGTIPASADEILEAMTEAIEAYKEKEYGEAAASLDYAKRNPCRAGSLKQRKHRVWACWGECRV